MASCHRCGDELPEDAEWGLVLIKNLVDEMNVTSNQTHHTIELIVYLKEGGSDDDPSS